MKKYTKCSIFFAILCIFFLHGKQAYAAGTYADEGTSFYAQTNPPTYTIEGIAFYANNSQIAGTSPVYRFSNSANGGHFYTADQNEKNTLQNSNQSGFAYEGISFYAETSPGSNLMLLPKKNLILNGIINMREYHFMPKRHS